MAVRRGTARRAPSHGDSCIHSLIADIGGNKIMVSGQTLTGLKEKTHGYLLSPT